MRFIDLNADMGEYADDAEAANEEALMALVSSCSIACGGHSGDTDTMRKTARLAAAHGVSIGAHPSYPDREGFGRRSLNIDGNALRHSIRKQIDEFAAALNEEGIVFRHVKPHGALYNDAARDEALASIIAEEAGDVIVVGPAGSALERAATEAGRRFAAEGFVDRLYQQDGSLTPRTEPGAIIADLSARAEQARRIAQGEAINAAGGALTVSARTLCIHSDSPGAVETAQAVRDILSQNGIAIAAFAGRLS